MFESYKFYNLFLQFLSLVFLTILPIMALTPSVNFPYGYWKKLENPEKIHNFRPRVDNLLPHIRIRSYRIKYSIKGFEF